MNPAAGQTLLHYRLIAPIGQGGMGVVWRAHDTTLGRDVALKFLPEMLTGDPERMARLEREARLLASLNHPHVASIYGFHAHEGARFLAMELVEGEDLSQRLAHGPIPVADALPIALQIAEALEHAHEKGVIHRDLKPANVKLDATGSAKVLDFGLAKAIEGDPSNPRSGSALSHSPTITGGMTAANVLLGTAAYMSPEQARGQVADRRADIWAFGVVLMEMLTGRRLFEGETISDTLAAVLRADPDFDALPKDTPPRVRRLLRRCLERDPKKRLRDIGEARILLDEVIRGVPDEAAPAATSAPSPSRGFPWMPLVGGLVLGGIVAFVAGRSSAPRFDAPVRRFTFQADTSSDQVRSPVISPDGRSIAALVGNRLIVRPLAAIESRSFPAEHGALALSWSPDSRNVVYASGNRLIRCSVTDGATTVLSDTRDEFTGGSGTCWTTRGTILFSRGDSLGIQEVSERGGDAKHLIPANTKLEGDLHEPYELPGGRGILFVSHSIKRGLSQLELWAKGRRRVLLTLEGQAIGNPCYDPAGYLLFRRNPNTPGIWAAPFSLSKLQVTGDPFLVVADAVLPSVSADGTLCYRPGDGGRASQLAWLPMDGGAPQIISESRERSGAFLTVDPTGPRVVRRETEGENQDLWMYDYARGTRTRLTFSPDEEDLAAFSPDGRRIAYMSHTHNCGSADCWKVVVATLDRTGTPDTIATSAVIPTWTPDGREILYMRLSDDFAHWSLYRRPIDLSAPETEVLRGNPRIPYGIISPDGTLLAYMSLESDRYEVYLTRFPGAEGRWQVSTRGGQFPQWSPRGDRLYYVHEDEIYSVAVTSGAAVSLGAPTVIARRPRTNIESFNFEAEFYVSPDGRRFLTSMIPEQRSADVGLGIVENWSKDFRGRK